MNKTLKECITEARQKGVAIGHFNVSNIEGFWAVVNAAKEVNAPVIIGVSEGERDFVGTKEIYSIVKSYRERTGQLVYINADHTYSFERVKEVIDIGYDSVIFDGTELSFEENVAITKKCVEYARSVNSNILIEAELGFIGKSSKVLDSVPEGVGRLTEVNEAIDFVKETGIDMLAPAVGNIHGMVKGGEPDLNIVRIEELSKAIGVPLVLHGASGNSNTDITNAIKSGISIVHVNTELRVAFRSGLEKSLKEMPNEVSPYKYLSGAREVMQKVVIDKLRLFNNIV
jgi:fructose-bisphosphate aldolase class II